MSKKVLITQSNYIPWKGYFDAINQADEFILFDEVQYTRRDWRNRNLIKTANGVRWLTIPVATKGNFKQNINETRVSVPNWCSKHWDTIRANYVRAPFFKLFAEEIESLYLDNTEELLSRINEKFVVTLNGILGINTKMTRCEDYGVSAGKTDRLIDLCLKSGASEYLTGPAAKAYLNESQFAEAGITVHWLDYTGYPQYPQMHDPFEHGVSILDLIFNTGPSARQYMKSFQRPS